LEGVHSDIILPSRYSYMNMGERDLENPLKFDKVPAANYALWNNYQNFNQVIENCKTRIANNTYFKLIESNSKWLKKAQEDTLVYLSLDAYENDLENHKNESLKYKSIRDYTTNLTYESPLYEQTLLIEDADLSEKRIAWHKNLKKDIYIEEALTVLSELKLKPQYHLVKK